MDLKNINKNNICCFFGHRNITINIIPSLQKQIEKFINDYNIKIFYVGGYGDFDKYAVQVLLKLKKQYTRIKLVLIPAYLSTLESKKDFINDTYDYTIFPGGVENTLQRFAILKRNRWIVENSHYMIAYVKLSSGGAYTAFKYAKRKKLKIINIA